MRITVNLEPDTAQIVQTYMRDHDLTTNDAVNQIIRRGAPSQVTAFRTATASMGKPSVDLDHALDLLGKLEDDELIRRMRDDT